MASIEQPVVGSKQRIHAPLRIDMTPMVDLGFLLITFFIFTTTMAEHRATKLVMPKEGDPMPVKESHVLTALLGGNDQVFVYEGKWEDAVAQHRVIATGYDEFKGLGRHIRLKQQKLGARGEKKDLLLLIKPLESAAYKNLVDALDETLINNVEKYAIAEATGEEREYVANVKTNRDNVIR